jgi:hypothetical protein
LAYPGLKIQLEGHTDSIGSDEYNMTLSQHRADGVRTYLLSQGVPADTVTAVGMGKASPVADNSTPAGRQQNRRVEMIVSGAPIGIDSGSNPKVICVYRRKSNVHLHKRTCLLPALVADRSLAQALFSRR